MSNKFSEMYRVQSSEVDYRLDSSRIVPVKRVLVSGAGKIMFNPNQSKFIYFSKTDKHHIYYIFNKVFYMIVEELNKYNDLKQYKNLGLPDSITFGWLLENLNVNILKKVKNFFSNYIPEMSVELVSILYINAFKDFLEKCVVNNKRKTACLAPEVSDTRCFGGAYGLNESWLELLKHSTVGIKLTSLSFENVFEFLTYNSLRTQTYSCRLKSTLNNNDELFNFTNFLTYRYLPNPDFYNPNNINLVIASINNIFDLKLHNFNYLPDNKQISDVKKAFKEEIREM